MHPVAILVPIAALIFGPRYWVRHVLQEYNRSDENFPGTAAELAREFLDRHQLRAVKVERTDLGDHYDPEAKAVRLHRDKFDRKTLTAVTTAAHEVSHAVQDASGYGPFVWRTHLVKVAQVAGEVGAVLLIAVPVAALITQSPLPPIVIGAGALVMLGSAVAVELVTLPTELNASFARALPLLQDGYITGKQVEAARRILTACSLTYVASSLAAILNIWPWLGRPAVTVRCDATELVATTPKITKLEIKHPRTTIGTRGSRRRHAPGVMEALVRQIGKPLIRGWIRFSRGL